MTWKEVFPKIKLLLRYENPPEILIIHCGGNDIGKTPLLGLRKNMAKTVHLIGTMLPNTKLGWSCILPRTCWRFSKNPKSQNIAAKRINNFMSHLFDIIGGFYIKYQELSWDCTSLFRKDGVHLSELGNDIFLYRLQSKLQEICSLY